ncbi:MAG: retropepsin-like aspartic protease [Candidatus Edwardsbacteria bacterium]
MGLIYKEVELVGQKGKKKVPALFDIGSSQSFMRKSIAEEITTPFKIDESLEFETASGTIRTDLVIFSRIILDGHKIFWTFIIVEDLTEELILGADFFQRWKIRLDPETEEIIWDPKALKLTLI